MKDKISIKRKKMKNMILKVKPDGTIHLSVPYGLKDEIIDDFIKRKREWIEDSLKNVLDKNKRTTNISMDNGEVHYYLGKPYILKVISALKEEVKIEGEDLVLYTRYIDNKEKKALLLNYWYKNQAREIFNKYILMYSKILNKNVNKVAIKSMKTRWGSCSVQKRNISLNLELIKKPLECIEYVVLHEIAHIEHPNHSKDFWNYVGVYMPNYKEIKKKL
ncbi:M48 family metallopeptidase [Clostridium sp.]|uniref:M48 family metallopeptidase n=1 Tax=Clostridium sp. TaxID=1506 RepID=UPI003F2E9E1A